MTLRLGEVVIDCADHRGESMAAEVERLLGLGARVIAGRSLGESVRWTVMADPEGNEFCVSGA